MDNTRSRRIMSKATAEPKPGAPLRCAALIRVSTEKQEKQGESLRTQRTQLTQCAEQLGTIACWYGGQEHATAGWEREQLERLLADARRTPKPFDAVIVAHPDRWSRDNARSKPGLDLLRDNGIRFFVMGMEYNLYDPTARFYLEMSATIGGYQASLQSKKSLEMRIHRAKRGLPTCGKLPYGRTFNKDTGKWSIIPKTQAILQDVATRYLNGESMGDLSREYNINQSFLHKTLTTGCGAVWEQRFRSPQLLIDETVTTPVPALLEPAVIMAVQHRAAANKTYAHGHLIHRYLFSRMVFCGVCGYAMSGQMNSHGGRYYRHQLRNGAANCPLHFRPWVPADLVEVQVLDELAGLWGNPKAVEKALADAEPNKEEIGKLRRRLDRIEEEQVTIKRARDRILGVHREGPVD